MIDFIRVLSLLGLVSVCAMGMERAYFWYQIGCWSSRITSHETFSVRASDCVCRFIDTLIQAACTHARTRTFSREQKR